MNYSEFEPYPFTNEEKTKMEQIGMQKQTMLQKFIDQNQLLKIHTDYFSIEQFFYNKNTKKLYKTSCHLVKKDDLYNYDDDQFFNNLENNFTEIHDPHILEMNELAT